MIAPRRIVFMFIVTVCTIEAMAQNDDCESTISRALSEFEAGHFYAIPAILDPCLSQLTDEQQQRAYLLLTQTYLLLDDPIGAKRSYLSVLNANPEFATDTALHPIDVIYLGRRFTASPVWSWFVGGGTNISFPRVIHDRTTIGESSADEKYVPKFGYQLHVGVDLAITPQINLRTELNYAMAAYQHNTTNFFQFDTKEFVERQSWLRVPVSVVYNFQLGRYRPYGYAGYAFNYLVRDRADVTITNNRPVTSAAEPVPGMVDREETPEAGQSIDMLFKRNRVNHNIVLGGGVKMKMGLDFIFIDLRYNAGLKNVISNEQGFADYNTDDHYSNEFVESQETSLRYMHVDDYFRLDNLSITVGFIRPLYKPRELKRARTKPVLKKINKG